MINTNVIMRFLRSESVKNMVKNEGITSRNVDLVAADLIKPAYRRFVYAAAKPVSNIETLVIPYISEEEDFDIEVIKPEEKEINEIVASPVEESVIVEPVVEEPKEEPVVEVKPKRKSTKKVVEEPIELEVEVAREEDVE